MSTVSTEFKLWKPPVFSTITILMIPVAVAINAIGHALVSVLRLPIFLDSIGTLLAGMIGGPWVGALTGLLTNVVNGITNPVYFFYTPTSVLIGVLAGVFSYLKFFQRIWTTILSAVLIMVTATIASGLVTAIVFSGATGGTGSVFTSVLLATGKSLITAVFTVHFFQEFGDKLISVVLAVMLARSLPVSYLVKFRNGINFIHKAPLDTQRDSASKSVTAV